MLVVAHGDDETFIFGGTVAKYAQLGYQIDLLVLTKDLNENKIEELKEASKTLGIKNVIQKDYYPTFTYSHSGKCVTNNALTEISSSTIVKEIYQEIHMNNPDVILTFDPTGVSGHPDHIYVNECTRSAVKIYAERKTEARLYEIVFLSKLFSVQYNIRKLGREIKALFFNTDKSNLNPIVSISQEVSTKVRVASWLDIRQRAIMCHSTSFQEGRWYLKLFEKMNYRIRGFIIPSENYFRTYPEIIDFDDSTSFFN
jgi:LmbE family N-acetylglucosaminyl deacetylase